MIAVFLYIASILTLNLGGNNRLHFPLPPPDTKLAVIRRSIAEYTHLPELSFKLIHAGAVMKDDNAPSCVVFPPSVAFHFRSISIISLFVLLSTFLCGWWIRAGEQLIDVDPLLLSTSIRLFYPRHQTTPVIRLTYLPNLLHKILPCHVLIIAPSHPFQLSLLLTFIIPITPPLPHPKQITAVLTPPKQYPPTRSAKTQLSL